MKACKKLNNKGFSMVELIIVIVIMAVLAGILSPAYAEYEKKSRRAADVQAISEAMGAMGKIAVDPSYEFITDNTMTAIFSKEATVYVHGENTSDNVTEAMRTILGDYRLKSDWEEIEITGTVHSGHVTYSCKQIELLEEHSKKFAGQFVNDAY